MSKVTRLNVGEGAPARTRQFPLREVPDDADAPLGTVGQELRGARMSRGEDITTVSRALKIRKEHLEAIEDDRFSALPGRTYAVGFVRAYAEYVGLDPGYAVDRFKAEVAGREEVSKTAGFPEQIEEPGLSRGWLFVAVIVVGLIAYGIYYLFAAGAPETRQPVSAVPAQMIEHKPALSARAPAVSQHPAKGAVNPKSQASAASASLAGTARTVDPGPGGQVYGKMNTNAHVILRVTQPTRVLVQTEDGRSFINKELQSGDIYQVPNMHGLALTAEHGNAIQIVLDGNPIRMAGKTADPAEALSLDPEVLTGRNTGSASQ